jgi:hypothetical protein
MVVYVEWCLFCDECGANWFDDGQPRLRPMERRKIARERDGWSCTGRGKHIRDLCPECATKENAHADAS